MDAERPHAVTRTAGSVLVRAVSPDEVDVCRALGALTVAAYTALPGNVAEPDYDAELADVAGRAALPSTTVLAAVDPGAAGAPLGGVTYIADGSSPLAEFADRDAAGFRMLAVVPEARGRGVGEALAAACIERARSDGRAAVVIHSSPWMEAAHRLYARLGFRRDPGLDWTPVPGIDLVGFRLPLR